MQPNQILCTSATSRIFFIKCPVDDFHARDIIRKTWAVEARQLNIVPTFTVGFKPNQNQSDALLKEAQTNEDILQSNVEERYENMVTKVYNTLYWFAQVCNQSDYVMLGDTDVLSFPSNLIKYFTSVAKGAKVNKMIYGSFAVAHKPHRDPSSKWYDFYL